MPINNEIEKDMNAGKSRMGFVDPNPHSPSKEAAKYNYGFTENESISGKVKYAADYDQEEADIIYENVQSNHHNFRKTFKENLIKSFRKMRHRKKHNPEMDEDETYDSLELENQMRSEGYLSSYGHEAPAIEDVPKPTDPLIKKEFFYHMLCENLSKMYAILLFIVGCVLYITDINNKGNKAYAALGEGFNVVLIILQLAWFAFTHFDVRRYVNSLAKSMEEAKDKPPVSNFAQPHSPVIRQQQMESIPPKTKKSLPHHYGFTSGRHGGSTYLKIGAAVFCFGFLIHTGLNFAVKVIPYFEEDHPKTFVHDLLLSVLQPIYAFNQLYFIYKYSNLIINRGRRLSRFALMHCISASLLFWVHTIIQETMHSLSKHGHEEHPNSSPSHDTHDQRNKRDAGEEDGVIHEIQDITPYLYPFSIEYNILVVGFWILLWENIGRMDRHDHVPTVHVHGDDHLKGVAPTLSINVDCSYSQRGLFAGLFITVISAISVILQYVLSETQNQKDSGLIINASSEIIFHVVMIIAAMWAFVLIQKLDVSKHVTSNIDDIMLYMCLPSIFLYSVFSMIAAIKEAKVQFVIVSIVQITQAIIQTALISDGLTRRANSAVLATKKPGREILTFLIVANVAIWLLETFQIKFEEYNNYKYVYYGEMPWTFISHVTLPMALFYRFHSSVCLVDIWKGGYQKDSKH